MPIQVKQTQISDLFPIIKQAFIHSFPLQLDVPSPPASVSIFCASPSDFLRTGMKYVLL